MKKEMPEPLMDDVKAKLRKIVERAGEKSREVGLFSQNPCRNDQRQENNRKNT
jgi:hypothetical protein